MAPYEHPGQEHLRDLFDLLTRGANFVAPAIMSLMRGEPAPPLPNVPDMAQKVPSTDDPRPLNAAAELANIGTHLMPLGPVPASAARSLPALLGLLRREAPALETMASKSPFMYNPS